MPRYLFRASYTIEAPEDVAAPDPRRRAGIERALQAVGGRLEGFSCALDADVVGIAELPDHLGPAALTAVLNASGVVRLEGAVLIMPRG